MFYLAKNYKDNQLRTEVRTSIIPVFIIKHESEI